jgi:hypothetical protein
MHGKDREIGEKPRCKAVPGPIDSERRTKSRNPRSKYASLRPRTRGKDHPSKWLQVAEPERARELAPALTKIASTLPASYVVVSAQTISI